MNEWSDTSGRPVYNSWRTQERLDKEEEERIKEAAEYAKIDKFCPCCRHYIGFCPSCYIMYQSFYKIFRNPGLAATAPDNMRCTKCMNKEFAVAITEIEEHCKELGIKDDDLSDLY